MYSILEEKHDGYKRVIFLMPTKDTHFYHFVNPEKGHIAHVVFKLLQKHLMICLVM